MNANTQESSVKVSSRNRTSFGRSRNQSCDFFTCCRRHRYCQCHRCCCCRRGCRRRRRRRRRRQQR